jgi:tetratricopeptide (TPR) repeat protein
MNKERLKSLMEFLEKDPNDPFLIYAIATEYGIQIPDKALKHYQRLLNDFPDYSATYYHAAALFAETGQLDRAKEIYEKGLVVCEKEKNVKALFELKNAYQNFLFEYEDEL